MGAILSRYLYPVLILGVTALLLLGQVYHKGYQKATAACQQEKQELITQNEKEKNQIVSKLLKKSPIERRKELGRFMINEN